MKIVLQRCSRAEVRINGETVGRIGTGFVVLVGITHNDTREDAEFLAKKVAGMRVFEDTEGKMNLSLAEVGGQILSISQFTLYGNARKGNRPSFIEAARPEVAEPLYEYFNQVLREQYGLHVETGRFGANMQVDFVNDGPETIIVDSCQGSVIGINN
ncbi:MAG: D-tyrosyl-tRNA(Tyr) deacylase [Bacteroidales bacterium]|nr:D-tyrosyl-tRNA(Tyr) deacylase [Bacteroidales bacterium]